MEIAKPKIASTIAQVVVGVAILSVVLWFCLPIFRAAVYRPATQHRTAAVELLQSVIGDDAQKAKVPAVNVDIGLIYVTVPLSPAAMERVKAKGKSVAGMPGDVYEIPSPDRAVMIDLKTSPSKIMIGAASNTWNGERCVLRYREWLEGKKLPWP